MPIITWNHLCNFCHRPIIRGKTTILFTTDKPLLIGVSHATCSATKYHIGRYQMNPPDFLSWQEVSFLIQFYPMFYSLPGVFNPNAALRESVASFLHYYPSSMINPMKCLYNFLEPNKDNPQTYQGDLEADYLRFLAKVQKAAKENPIDVEFDFRKRG